MEGILKSLDQAHEVITFRQISSSLLKDVEKDIKRAKDMEEYLRDFKEITYAATQEGNNFINEELDTVFYTQIANEVAKAIGVTDHTLFRRRNRVYLQQSRQMGADDIFELEFTHFLNKMIDQMIQEEYKNIDYFIGDNAQLLGREKGALNIQDASLYGVNKALSSIDYKKYYKATARAGKADVGSFNVEISASLTPYWSNFLKAFNAAKFTVKNISEASYDITLGESILEKSITAPLMHYGGLDYNSATKIYKQAISIVTNKGSGAEEVGQHILHLRFAYELAGEGLVTEDGSDLKGADFFIYNDPDSTNIYVRSTKAMIRDYVEGKGFEKSQNPLNSRIAISKASFA